jgi:hypothetical protein
MKSVQKKSSIILFALILNALSNSSASQTVLAESSQPNFITHIDHIRSKTFASLGIINKIKPEDLEKQIDPVLHEVKSVPNMHEYLIDHLFEIMVEVSEEEKEGAQKVKDELVNAGLLEKSMEEVTLQEKEQILNSFTFEAVAAIFDHIGEKIFRTRHPFRIPETTENISQLDMFFFLGTALTMQDANPVQEELHSAFLSCLGLKNVIKIQQRLNKPEIIKLLPASMCTKFFSTRNPLRVAAIVKQVMMLSRTYTSA